MTQHTQQLKKVFCETCEVEHNRNKSILQIAERDRRELLETISACLMAAGAPSNLDEQEEVVRAAGDRPSQYIAQQFNALKVKLSNCQYYAKKMFETDVVSLQREYMEKLREEVGLV